MPGARIVEIFDHEVLIGVRVFAERAGAAANPDIETEARCAREVEGAGRDAHNSFGQGERAGRGIRGLGGDLRCAAACDDGPIAQARFELFAIAEGEGDAFGDFRDLDVIDMPKVPAYAAVIGGPAAAVGHPEAQSEVRVKGVTREGYVQDFDRAVCP